MFTAEACDSDRHWQVSAAGVPTQSRRVEEDAGWHLTYLMPPLEIQRKLRSFAHTEYVPTPQAVIRCVKWQSFSARNTSLQVPLLAPPRLGFCLLAPIR
jgi:hypothetical protein